MSRVKRPKRINHIEDLRAGWFIRVGINYVGKIILSICRLYGRPYIGSERGLGPYHSDVIKCDEMYLSDDGSVQYLRPEIVKYVYDLCLNRDVFLFPFTNKLLEKILSIKRGEELDKPELAMFEYLYRVPMTRELELELVAGWVDAEDGMKRW